MKLRVFRLILALAMLFSICHAEEGELLRFRPVDCGVQAQMHYEFPFAGFELTLPDKMLEMIDSREIFVFTDENYASETALSYAVLRFSETTEEQRSQEGFSVDIFAWEESLNHFGAIGVYDQESYANIDALTGCDTHRKIGESIGGEYEYYLSLNSSGDAALTAELESAEIFIDEMHDLNLEMGYTAFSSNRIEGVNTVGEFSTTDVFGNEYTQAVFAEYDLTLVNVFATWCSPCVEEMPELEKLRKEMIEDGLSFNVIAVVMDADDPDALSCARQLSEVCDNGFAFLIPDSGNMNQRLTGIAAYPESFFVDGNGCIVSDAYLGANDWEGWREIVFAEMEALK